MKQLFKRKGINSCFPKWIMAAALIILTAGADAQTWKIFTSEYSYNSGNVSINKVIKTKNITDVIKAEDGTIWISCGDSYPFYIRNMDNYNPNDYEVGMADPEKMKQINYIPSGKSKFLSLQNGDLWLMTRQNLLRMSNGESWEGLNTEDVNKSYSGKIPVPQFNLFGGIAKDNKDNLWITGVITGKKNTCGLAKFENNSWTYFFLPDDITSKLLSKSSSKGFQFLAGKEMIYGEKPSLRLILSRLCFDKNDNAWMSVGDYQDEGLLKFSNGQFSLFNTENGKLSSDVVLDINSDKQGQIHISTSEGLLTIKEDNFIPFEKPYMPLQMAFDNNNLLWWSGEIMKPQSNKKIKLIQTETVEDPTILRRYDKHDKSSYEFGQYNTPLTKNVTRVYIDKNNIKYFVVNGDVSGLYILNDDTPEKDSHWKRITPYKDGLSAMLHYKISAGFNDKDWYFTGISDYYKDNSLNALKDGNWTETRFEMADEPTGIFSTGLDINAITIDKNKNLFIGTNNYVYKYDTLANVIEGLDKSKLSKVVNCLSTDQTGRIWIGSTKGLASYDGSKFTYFDKSNSSVPGAIILNLLSDSKDRTWVGTPNGLVCFDKEKQTLYNKKNGLNNERVVALAENNTGKVFIATSNFNSVCRSIYTEDNGVLTEEQLPEPVRINKMVFDRNNDLWIGCDGCLICRRNNGEYKIFDKNNSPIQLSQNINKLFIIGNEIWLGIVNSSNASSTTTSGIQKGLKPEEILNLLKPKLTGLEQEDFTLVFQPDIL